MNRRNYLQLLSTLFATSVFGSCRVENDSAGSRTEELSGSTPASSSFEVPRIKDGNTIFYLVSDLGRNGYYEQKSIAELMGNLGEKLGPDFIVAAGDTHHFEGVASTSDPLWMTNYELVYSHPELMIDWFAICGNHEYRGNTDAVLEYSKISRRWEAPARYYSKVVDAGENEKALLLFVDTTPLIDKYRKEAGQYPDASLQDTAAQLKWIDKTLSASDEKWKIVIGHHPLYAETPKTESERSDMRSRLEPLLNKHGVDVYFCGHIHNFQHIQPEGSRVDYVVNSSGSLPRKVSKIDGTVYCSPEAGFTVVTLGDDALDFHMMNGKGRILYSYSRKK